MTLILNTWIFEQDVKNGTPQAELVDRTAKLGADGIEIRREYFTDLETETAAVGERAKANGLMVTYSVPDELFFEDGQFNPKLTTYFDEAKAMGVSKIKFNTGRFDRYQGNLKLDLSRLPLNEIEMNVENDQTEASGNVAPIKAFLEAAGKVGFNQIGYVYDLGNWAFTGNDAIQSAKALAAYTNYIHLKNTVSDHGELKTSADLNTGIYDWKRILNELPNDVPIALEFPMATDKKIAAQMAILKAGAEG